MGNGYASMKRNYVGSSPTAGQKAKRPALLAGRLMLPWVGLPLKRYGMRLALRSLPLTSRCNLSVARGYLPGNNPHVNSSYCAQNMAATR